jgi:pimeloyl-ACP methyl ester carboxylesterase
LSTIIAARHPALVSKLILVGAGPFEEPYAKDIMDVRMGRLAPDDRHAVQTLIGQLEAAGGQPSDQMLARLGRLLRKADAYDPLPGEDAALECSAAIYSKVWPEASELRRSGGLLEFAKNIRCPVVAIHGDYDPHPAAGVREPLTEAIRDFRFILLEQCGHEPWREQRARETFYARLEEELSDG